MKTRIAAAKNTAAAMRLFLMALLPSSGLLSDIFFFKCKIILNNKLLLQTPDYFYRMLSNDLILRAARGEKTERTPVWLMRQAGRVLPEYREVRAKMGGFIELVKTPEFAAEVTVQPVEILSVDAAIIFSDILVIPEAMGLPYKMIAA